MQFEDMQNSLDETCEWLKRMLEPSRTVSSELNRCHTWGVASAMLIPVSC